MTISKLNNVNYFVGLSKKSNIKPNWCKNNNNIFVIFPLPPFFGREYFLVCMQLYESKKIFAITKMKIVRMPWKIIFINSVDFEQWQNDSNLW